MHLRLHLPKGGVGEVQSLVIAVRASKGRLRSQITLVHTTRDPTEKHQMSEDWAQWAAQLPNYTELRVTRYDPGHLEQAVNQKRARQEARMPLDREPSEVPAGVTYTAVAHTMMSIVLDIQEIRLHLGDDYSSEIVPLLLQKSQNNWISTELLEDHLLFSKVLLPTVAYTSPITMGRTFEFHARLKGSALWQWWIQALKQALSPAT